jgi:hypothetical protein
VANAAIPLIAAGISAFGSSAGSKKAAKGAKPDIPSIFKPAVGAALGPIYQRLSGGTPMFGGPSAYGSSLNQETIQGGYASALRNVLALAGGGLNQDVLNMAESVTRPLADIQRGDIVAGAREASAARGSLFSTGSQNTEMDALNRFEAQRRTDLLNQALQFGTQSLAAFSPLQGEFLRTQPDAGIAMLASLMGGTPFFTPPVPTNALQAIGGAANNLLQSPGFWEFLAQRGTKA